MEERINVILLSRLQYTYPRVRTRLNEFQTILDANDTIFKRRQPYANSNREKLKV